MGFAEYKKFDPVELGKQVLEKGKQDKCFEKVMKARQGAPEVVVF